MSLLSALSKRTVPSEAALEAARLRNKHENSDTISVASPSVLSSRRSSKAESLDDTARSSMVDYSFESDDSTGHEQSRGSSHSDSNRSHSRKRVDETTVSPNHAKRLAKSRRYQERMRVAKSVDKLEITDSKLKTMLLSRRGKQRFPETSAMLAANETQVAAAAAVKSMVEALPARSAHKSNIVAKLRGRMTPKQFSTFFTSISERYARKAVETAKKVEEIQAKGIKSGKKKIVDIFQQKRSSNDDREMISELESRITGKVVEEEMGHKSGREQLYWYGTLESFHKWYRVTGFPNIYAQMGHEAGSPERLITDLNATQWSIRNAEAYICQGKCDEICHHNYQPRSRPTLNKILKEQKLVFRCITKTVPCKWHDNWEKWKAELLREEAKPDGKRDLKRIQKLKVKLVVCKRHDDQYQVQRSYIQARIDALGAGTGEWVLYQDYLSWYSENGTKMNDLLFTVVTRRADGQLQYEYIHNVMTTEHTGASTRYAWAYHMRSVADGGSGELSSLPGPGVRTGDGGSDFQNYEFVMSETFYHELYGVEMESHLLCANHAWHPCDGAKRKFSKQFTLDQVEQGRGFSLTEEWLESAAGTGYENNRFYGHDADVMQEWILANQIVPRRISSWQLKNKRSYKPYRETLSEGKVFISGVTYAAEHSEINDADRVVMDFRNDDVAGPRCELCTQAMKRPIAKHKNNVKCPSNRGGRGAEPALAVHVKSGATDGMTAEEKLNYFAKLGRDRRAKKAATKGRFKSMLKADCVQLLTELGLPTDGLVSELRKRLDKNMPGAVSVSEAEKAKAPSAAKPRGKKRKKTAGKKAIQKKAAQKKAAKKKAAKKRKNNRGAAVAVSQARPPRRAAAAAAIDYAEADDDGEEAQAESESDGDFEQWKCDTCGVEDRYGILTTPSSPNWTGCELCGAGGPESSEDEEMEESEEDSVEESNSE